MHLVRGGVGVTGQSKLSMSLIGIAFCVGVYVGMAVMAGH